MSSPHPNVVAPYKACCLVLTQKSNFFMAVSATLFAAEHGELEGGMSIWRAGRSVEYGELEGGLSI